jgi:hypothetical protein
MSLLIGQIFVQQALYELLVGCASLAYAALDVCRYANTQRHGTTDNSIVIGRKRHMRIFLGFPFRLVVNRRRRIPHLDPADQVLV